MDTARPQLVTDVPPILIHRRDQAPALPHPAAHERFKALFGAAQIGVALCHLDGRFASVNAVFADLLQDTGIDVVHGSLSDLTRFLPAEADEHWQWPSDLVDVRNNHTHSAKLHACLAPHDAPARLVQATVAHVVLAEQPYLLTHLEDATGRRVSEQRLIYLATHDALTGLANRELVQQRLAAALRRGDASSLPVAVLYLDLDRFKLVNDTHGHHAGDALLAAVGTRLDSVLRAADTAGRLGGDEFLVVASDVADEVALGELQRRIERALCQPVEVDEVTIELRASIGAVLSRPGELPASVMRRADAAMYAAKRARRRVAGRTPTSTVQQQMVREQAVVAEQL